MWRAPTERSCPVCRSRCASPPVAASRSYSWAWSESSRPARWAHARLRASAVLSVDGERRFSRCRYAGTVWLGGRRSGAAEGEVVDLSAVGIRFRTASRLDPDDELELALEVPGQQPIAMRAQILRMRPLDDGRSEVAAEVTALESDDWARLERLLRFLTRLS